MMLPSILLLSRIKILLVLKKANKSCHLASRGQNIQLEKQGWTNFFLGARIGAQNQSVRPTETQLETLLYVLYYFSRTCSFHFKCVSIKCVCNEFFCLIVVLMSKIRCVSKNNFYTSDSSV